MLIRTLTAEEIFEKVETSAKDAGCKVGTVPYNPNQRRWRVRKAAININGRLYSIRALFNAQHQLNYDQVYAQDTMRYHPMLEKYFGTVWYINPEGYRRMILPVPCEDLRAEFYPNGDTGQMVSICIPLAYPPDNPRFDFLKYENVWPTERQCEYFRRQNHLLEVRQ